MTASAILEALKVKGVRLTRDGGDLIATPRAALTDELRALIREHKPELLQALTAEPSTTDKDFFRTILGDSRLAQYVGADAEERAARVRAQLEEYPNIRRAMAIGADGTVTVGVRVDGMVWLQELRIPPEKFDPFLILERFEKATLQ